MSIKVLLTLLAIPTLRFVINFNHSLYLRDVLRRHLVWIGGVKQGASEVEKKRGERAARWINANQTEIKRRVQSAGIENPAESYMEPLGLGYGQRQTITALDNLLFMNVKLQQQARQAISLAEGHYRTQALLSLSPLFWVEFVLFLPRELAKALGLEATSKISTVVLNLIQIIYWAILTVTTIITVLSY